MSDTGRQSFTDKAANALKPESEKSTTERAGDKASGLGDSIASTFQPESQKSTSQKVTDTFSSNSNENQDSLLNKAKDAVGMGSSERK